ncbi:MAG TPA: ribulose-phosphate 3-epimerase [Buchnera sp. (in: enterobacteria)]|nr:ribulose-phosphate 3-epimerase [Buchnera sp. (in: enterobacteria)]
MKKFLLSPSILSADFSRLGEDIKTVLNSGADTIHFDVMDNHFVPNLTIGPMVLKSLRNYNINVDIDVHLMTKPVDNLIIPFVEAGANLIIIHPETTDHLDRTLNLIKKYNCKVGLGINPATPLMYLDYVMDKLDMILLMTVNPGFSGQDFIPSSLNKIRKIKKIINDSGYPILLAVDGGIKIDNIANIELSGADVFIFGSAIFHSINYRVVIENMRNELDKIHHSSVH